MTIWNPNIEQYSGPRYKALADAIAADIEKGVLKPDQKLPTHRALAELLGVTVGTITRGYAEAEKRGLVVARVGSGTFIRPGQQKEGAFFIHEEDDSVIDLSLSLVVPANREQDLAQTLRQLGEDPAVLAELLGYIPEKGLLRHREATRKWAALSGIDVTTDQILITNGGQHGINIVLQALLRAGERVLAEGITYPAFIGAARQLQLRPVGISYDDHGIIPEQFESLCQQYQPKLLYWTPNLQNPTTITAPLERRLEILEIAAKHDLFILEDAIQGCLQKEAPTSLFTLAPERVIHVGSYSKTMTGGLRAGFILSPPNLIPKLGAALRINCWMASPLMNEIARQWIESGKAIEMLEWQREELRQRHKIVAEIFEGLDFKHNPDGFNVWLELPDPWRGHEFEQELERKGVLIKSAEVFAVGRFHVPHGVRICISTPPDREKLTKGLKIIRETLGEPLTEWGRTI